MRALTIERDRQTGRSTELMLNAADFLEKNPESRIVVISSNQFQNRNLAQLLVKHLGANNMAVKRAYFVTPNSSGRGVNYDAAYIDNAEYIDLSTFLDIAALPLREMVMTLETGNDPLWLIQHYQSLKAVARDSRQYIEAIMETFEEEARVRGV